MPHEASRGGTGSKFGEATIVVCGVASLVATVVSLLSIWLQTKNYRKPLLQRYVIRILLMVPIYAAASWASLMSQNAAFYLDPIRDIYEAFTIYTFFQLLINFLGGERALIIMMRGRPPVHHPWPLTNLLSKVDISDPHTFLSIKRGILQYAWLKPVLGLATIIMKSTHIYQEGYIGLTSGYLWSSILYNLSVTISLYSLAMFWVCMSEDLHPFRPVPKFLCIKLIIFASYWQGFFLSILQWLGAIPNDVPGYTPNNLAAAIQDALICCEMPLFAISHWYAFSWHDYADVTISAARMPVKYALRDAFGIRDLIEDTKETFAGKHYEYRIFDSGDNILAHEESDSRVARMMEGMRYERGGKGKYWIPKPGEINNRTPLLADTIGASQAAPMANTINRNDEEAFDSLGRPVLDPEDEKLFTSARDLEYGDWNYPVITAHIPSSDIWLNAEPNILTTSTNQHLLHHTKAKKARREEKLSKKSDKGKHKSDSDQDNHAARSRAPVVEEMLKEDSGSSVKSGRSQLVDLVIEDTEAEERERVRARKEGGAEWNDEEAKYFVKTYENKEDVTVRSGFEPGTTDESLSQVKSSDFAVGDDEDGSGPEHSQNQSEEDRPQSDHDDQDQDQITDKFDSRYEGLDDQNVWKTKDGNDM